MKRLIPILIVTLAVLGARAVAQPTPVPGLQRVAHDSSMSGSGTIPGPLGVRVATGGGITTNGGTTGVGLGVCPSGQVWQSVGATWACADNANTVAGAFNTIAMFTPDGAHVGNSLITQSGTTDTVNGTLGVNTSGETVHFSGYHGANSDGHNIWIGNGGLNSIGSIGDMTQGSYNVSLGHTALAANTTGEASIAIGYAALNANTTGQGNVAIGYDALLVNTTGLDTVAVGYAALAANTSGSGDIAVGFKALFTNTTGSDNVAVGYAALLLNTTGANNAALGYDALLSNTTGDNNTAIGLEALLVNTTGAGNTAIGFLASSANTTGADNVAIGPNSLLVNTTGIRNIAIGSDALADLLITGGTGNNTVIGYNTGRGIVTGVKNTIVGANVTGLSSSLSNQIIIADGDGNKRIQVDSSAHTTLAGNVQIMATGATWTSGTGVPAISCAKGDRFSRTDGGVGSTDYDCTATNTWTALSSTVGTVTSVSATAPITSTGGATPTIAISEGNGITNSGGAIVANLGAGLAFSSGAIVPNLPGGACSAGSHVSSVAADGTASCSSDYGSPSVITVTGTGTLDDWTPSGYTAATTLILLSSSSGNITLDGLTGCTAGRVVTLGWLDATNLITVKFENTGSSASNRLRAPWTASGQAFALAANGGRATFQCSTNGANTRWDVVAMVGFEQPGLTMSGSINANGNSITGASTLGVTGLSTLTGGFTLGADSSANTHKITSLTNGSSAQDAAAFGQISSAVNAAVSGTANTTTKFTGTNAVGNAWALDDATSWGVSGKFQITEATGFTRAGAGADAPSVASAIAIFSNAGTTSIAVRDSTNDHEIYLKALATGGAEIGTSTNDVFAIRTNNTIGFGLDTAQNATHYAHVNASGSTPTINSCGTPGAIVGTDFAGIITVGTSTTTCSITFANAFTNTPVCTASANVTAAGGVSITTISNTGVTFSPSGTALSGDKLYYLCVGQGS